MGDISEVKATAETANGVQENGEHDQQKNDEGLFGLQCCLISSPSQSQCELLPSLGIFHLSNCLLPFNIFIFSYETTNLNESNLIGNIC